MDVLPDRARHWPAWCNMADALASERGGDCTGGSDDDR